VTFTDNLSDLFKSYIAALESVVELAILVTLDDTYVFHVIPLFVVYTLLNHFKGILVNGFHLEVGTTQRTFVFAQWLHTSNRGGFTKTRQTSQLVQSKIIHKENNSSLRG
jgi:hypothetical protein